MRSVRSFNRYCQHVCAVNTATCEVEKLAGQPSDKTGGFLDGAGSEALFYNPSAVAVDSSDDGCAMVVDCNNCRIRRVSLPTRFFPLWSY